MSKKTDEVYTILALLFVVTIPLFLAFATDVLKPTPEQAPQEVGSRSTPCHEPHTPVQLEHFITGLKITIHRLDGPIEKDGRIVEGYTEFHAWPEYNMAICDIYTQLPKFVNNDEQMDTLGHELLHCIGGRFHR